MIVMKFGGTSVEDSAAIQRAAEHRAWPHGSAASRGSQRIGWGYRLAAGDVADMLPRAYCPRPWSCSGKSPAALERLVRTGERSRRTRGSRADLRA